MGRYYSHLTAAEREEISRALALGHSCQPIARQVCRNTLSISREIKRNAQGREQYHAATAQRCAQRHARHPCRAHKLRQPWLARYVQTALFAGWSA